MFTLVIGLCAATLTTISFIPQVIKIYKTKNAGDLSLATFCIFCAGIILWLVYGIAVSSLPIIVGNIITLILIVAIIIMRIMYR